MILVLKSAWEWLRKWGGWIAGVVVALALFFFRRKTPVTLDTSKKDAVEKKTEVAEHEVLAEAKEEQVKATEAHDQGLAMVLEKERSEAGAIEDDPAAVNEILKQAGKAARGDKT